MLSPANLCRKEIKLNSFYKQTLKLFSVLGFLVFLDHRDYFPLPHQVVTNCTGNTNKPREDCPIVLLGFFFFTRTLKVVDDAGYSFCVFVPIF